MNRFEFELSIELPDSIDPKDFARYVKEFLSCCQFGSDPMDIGIVAAIEMALDSCKDSIECRVMHTTPRLNKNKEG